MKFVFVKIPKTGSTFFEKNFNKKRTKINGRLWLIWSVGHSWLYPTQIKGWRDWDFEDQTPGLFRDVNTFKLQHGDRIVTIVRNPFELLFSYFNYNWSWCRNYHNLPEYEYTAEDFQKFVDIYLDDEVEFHAPALKKSLFSQLRNKKGEWILKGNSIILRFERLKEDIESFSKLVQIPITDYSDSAQNRAAVKPCNWWEAYREDQIEKLNKLWAEDLDYFGYEFKQDFQ